MHSSISIFACFDASDHTILLNVQGFRDEMIDKCKQGLLEKNPGKIDSGKVDAYCKCQVDLIRTNKLTDEQVRSINDPNSVFYYQVMYNCGNPLKGDDFTTAWSASPDTEINGPQRDTINLLFLNGMHYLKIKIGSVVYFWLFDTGASDMLITEELEQKLLNERVLKMENYVGTGPYEMANGEVDNCRRYKVDGLLVGQYSINNVIIAVSDKAKKVIAGKAFLNKFRHWTIDNSENTLIVNK